MLLDKNKTHKIVVFMPRYLGDCINCTPALNMLKTYYPHGTFYLVIREPAASVLGKLERVVCITDNRPKYKAQGLFSLVKDLRHIKASAAVLMTNTLVDAMICKLANIPTVVGYRAEMRGKLLTRSLKPDRNRHYINRYAYLANLLCNNEFKVLPTVSIPFDAQRSDFAADGNINIGFCIVSKAKLSRHYPVNQTVEVIKGLVEYAQHINQENVQFVMLGSNEEVAEAEQVVKICQQNNIEPVVSLAGKTDIHQLIDNIAALDLLITVDSGPLHIAAATGTQTIALHSKGTSPFSTVCPKQASVHVVNSRGGYINDNDQVLDLLPEDIVALAVKILSGQASK